MRWVRRILLIGLLVALPVAVHLFISRHSDPVAIDYVAGRVEVALWLALLVAFAAGIAVASLLAMLRGTRLRLEARRYRRAVRELESEVHQLRNLPLTEERPVSPPQELLAAAGREGGG